jgi:uncharacterized protein
VVTDYQHTHLVDRNLSDSVSSTFEAILEQRISRRTLLQGSAVVAAGAVGITAAAPALPAVAQSLAAKPLGLSSSVQTIAPAGKPVESLGFAPIAAAPITDDAVRVPAGYLVDVVAKWGDPITEAAPDFVFGLQTGDAQAQQVGYNHDFQAFFPLGDGSTEGVFFVNHEYTDAPRMIPAYDITTKDPDRFRGWVDVEIAAHGASVFEVSRTDKNSPWTLRRSGARNRRITGSTPMVFSGPAAGDSRLAGGVLGMFNNCGGGVTPWGTVLTCEENFNQYFANAGKVASAAERAHHARYGVPTGATPRLWENAYAQRFDLAVNRDVAYKYGWVVEIDPDDPKQVPVKHTSLGRFKHEAATCVVARTGQLVVYSGDDERNDYFYKFVSFGTFDAKLGKANSKLLTQGTLYVARVEADGSLDWIPLVFGSRPELSAPAFADQADILIRTREAGDAVRATRMDRPEDIEANPMTGKVYVALTNNSTRRSVSAIDGERATNPRSNATEGNRTGHILEITENGAAGHAGRTARWDIFILAGDPAVGKRVNALKDAKDSRDLWFAGYTGAVSPVGAPDNVAFSPDGMMWVATDGAPNAIGYNDALHAVPTTGPNRGQLLQFLSVPAGAETCGPEFTPDQTTLFIAVQHPGEDGNLRTARDPRTNTQSSWPEGPGNPAKPATIAIRHKDGKKIGE